MQEEKIFFQCEKCQKHVQSLIVKCSLKLVINYFCSTHFVKYGILQSAVCPLLTAVDQAENYIEEKNRG